MWVRGGSGRCSRMPCEGCLVQFSVFRRRRWCGECERCFCGACLARGGGGMCAPCRVLSTRPLARHHVSHLKVRDLQCFLQRQNVSTRGILEKEELVSLCVAHVNSGAYRRRGARAAGAGPFSSLKGLTTNLNKFINSTFDLNPSPAPSRQPHTHNSSGCHNAAHRPPPPPPASASTHSPPPAFSRERFTTTPGGEQDIEVMAPAPVASRSASTESARVDTTDCLEIEDLDDSGWEVVARPADPLPNDSDVLISEDVDTREFVRESDVDGDGGSGPPLSPARATSALELRSPSPADTSPHSDSTSLQDEPLCSVPSAPVDHTPIEGGSAIRLEQLGSASALEALSVRQLKELLARNRVEYRGCLERDELLERAQTLWRDHQRHRDDMENLPIEESCKICMSAPLECVLLECGHIAACTRCAAQLAECPICRRYVVRAVRCFKC